MKKVYLYSMFLLVTFVVGSDHAGAESSALERDLWDELFDPPVKEATDVKKGSELRKILFEALRPAISKEAKQTVKFSGTIRVFKNWAFFAGVCYDKKGELVVYPPLENSDTCALWLRTRLGWVLVDYSVGHSDVFWHVWHYQYGVPNEVLGFD